MKPILISGIQPSGKLHLGNYLGMLQKFIELQNQDKYRCFFFIADLHSLTEYVDPKERYKQIIQTTKEVMALGINTRPDQTISEGTVFFRQSAVPEHSELAIILNNFTQFSELRRMTQFKSKSELQQKNINVGLFDYPVLMASDILLYDAKEVPVGEDQLQHLELARTLARQFNKKFGKTFIEPEPQLTAIPRVMSLSDPKRKMSKSQPQGCIFLDDGPDVVKKKINSAVTDSGQEIKYDPKNKPAISNLLLLRAVFTGEKASSIAERYQGKGYVQFKKDLAEILNDLLNKIRRHEVSHTDKEVMEELEFGNQKAREIAKVKMVEVKKKIGLI